MRTPSLALLVVLAACSHEAAPSPSKGEAAVLPPKTAPQAPASKRVAVRNTDPRPAPGEEPRIVFEREFHDFGEVDEGTEHSADFPFRNEGKSPLKILHTRGECGCTVGSIEVEGKAYTFGDPISPGQKGIARVTLRTAGFGGTEKKDSPVYLITNEPPKQPGGGNPLGIASVMIHAKIRRLLEFESDLGAVNLGIVSNAQAVERTIVLRSTKGEPFQVVGFNPVDPQVQLHAEPADEKATRWQIQIRIPPGTISGKLSKHFAVVTSPAYTGVSFFVYGSFRGAVDVEPAHGVQFGIVAKGQSASRSVVVRNVEGTVPLKVESLRLLDPTDASIEKGGAGKPVAARVSDHMQLTVTWPEPGKVADIQLLVKETMPEGAFAAQLVFSSGVPGGPEQISLAVSGFVR
jgi:uncharacterized protein DUF1573